MKNQDKFKDFVRQAYDNKCALRGTSLVRNDAIGCEAAHIQPASHNGPLLPTNGILLSADLHKCFDGGLITLSDQGRVIVSKKIAQESLIREKIKKIELLKFYDFKKADKYSEQILRDFYKRLNFVNEDEFYSYLIGFNLNISDIKEKLKIETLWNELIFNKYNNQIKIDKEKIKTKIKNQKKILKEYNLSEILFQLNPDEKLLDKYNLILQNIENSGFKNSANIFSISDSSKFGGEIGWISQNQLNDNLLKEIENLNMNKLTKPIQTSSGYLIIKLNNKREKEKELDFERTFKQMITEEKNRQLNQFSLIYFNKIKQNTFISEK